MNLNRAKSSFCAGDYVVGVAVGVLDGFVD